MTYKYLMEGYNILIQLCKLQWLLSYHIESAVTIITSLWFVELDLRTNEVLKLPLLRYSETILIKLTKIIPTIMSIILYWASNLW